MSLKGKVEWIWWLVLGGLQTELSWRPTQLGDEAARWLPQQQKGSGWDTGGGLLGAGGVLGLDPDGVQASFYVTKSH